MNPKSTWVQTQGKYSLTIAFAAVLMGVAGCSHARPVTDLAAPNVQPAASPAVAEAATQPAAAEALPVDVKTQSIYFDYDESNLKPDAAPFLAGFGGLLANHPDLHVRIEGNCDERGTQEYNLVLGQRRADTAKEYLVRMGVKKSQLETVSYGKDRPRATGHDEVAWQENRRDDFVANRTTVPGKPVAMNR